MIPNRIKTKIYLNEYNVLMGDTTYLPFVSGMLQSYAETFPEIRQHYQFMPPLFTRQSLQQILAHYSKPGIAAFSVFMWNEQLSLRVAEALKQRYPDCIVIFGGQQVPTEAMQYLERHPFIDVVVRGDGEDIFVALLRQLIVSRDLAAIPNITWRNSETGLLTVNVHREVLSDNLDKYPSPYLNGIFDEVLRNNEQITFQAIIQTNRGCPFTCAYCSWHKASRVHLFSLERVAAEIEWCGRNHISYVFNADANFGIHPRDIEIARVLANTKAHHGYPDKFRSCFMKNADDRIYELAMLLLENNLEKGMTLSFQTLSKAALRNIRRNNIRLSTYHNLLSRFNAANVPVYTELILGLPGETTESWLSGVEQIFRAGLTGQLFVYPCEIYPNAEMGDDGYRERFGVKTRRIRLTEIHGAVRNSDLVPEYQEIIIATESMPFADWHEMMIVSWLTMTLFSLKLGYFFLIYLRNRFSIPSMDFILFLMRNERAQVVQSEVAAYRTHLDGVLTGEIGRGIVIGEYGDIYWDVEEASFIRIISILDAFYSELASVSGEYLETHQIPFDTRELDEAILYQKLRIPTPSNPMSGDFTFLWNFPEYFSQQETGSRSMELVEKQQALHVSGTDFANDLIRYGREVILWGRKSNNALNAVDYSEEGIPPAMIQEGSANCSKLSLSGSLPSSFSYE